jgi:hypothetical protein
VKPEHLKVLAIVVAGLLVLWGFTALLPSGTDRPTADFRLPRVPAESVVTITITAPAETVTLSRGTDSAWTVNGFAANRDGVQQLIAALGATAPPELVARSSSSFTRLGLDSASRRLRVRGKGTTLLDLVVSSRTSDLGAAYVRLPGDSAVYTWPGRLSEFARRHVDDWRDRTIGGVAVVTDSVERIEVSRGTRRYTLRRQDAGAGHWLLGGAPADSGSVARLLSSLKTVYASGFATAAQLDSAFHSRIERRVAVFGPGAAPLLSLDFDSTRDAFWVRRSSGGTVYKVTTWDAEQLTPADSTLRKRGR